MTASYPAVTLQGAPSGPEPLRRWTLYPHSRADAPPAAVLVELVLREGGLFDWVSDIQLEVYLPVRMDGQTLRASLEARWHGIRHLVKKYGRKTILAFPEGL